MPPPAGTAERDNPARLLPADLHWSCSGLSWEQLIDLFRAVLPSYTKHAASACLAQHGSSLPQALRDLHQARACDWLAQDEYDAEVSKLISCTKSETHGCGQSTSMRLLQRLMHLPSQTCCVKSPLRSAQLTPHRHVITVRPHHCPTPNF